MLMSLATTPISIDCLLEIIFPATKMFYDLGYVRLVSQKRYLSLDNSTITCLMSGASDLSAKNGSIASRAYIASCLWLH